MAIQYQFTNSTNWESFWSQNYQAQPVLNVLERYYPIGKVSPGILLDSPIIAIYCDNPQAPLNWRYGARFFIKSFTGLTVNAGTPETVLKVGKIYLNQIEIIQIPPVASEFGIDFEIPYWHREFNLRIWKYTGNNQNTNEARLDAIKQDLESLLGN
jgi:hypothetical protein